PARVHGLVVVEIADVGILVLWRLLPWLPVTTLHQRVRVMSAVSAHDEGNLEIVPAEPDGSGVALIIMRMPGNEGMRIDVLLFADRIDFLQHVGAAAVIAATAARLGRRRVAERRMMHRDQDRALVVLLLDVVELCGQIVELEVRYLAPGFLLVLLLARDHARILERVAEQPDDPDEGSIERKI